MNRKLGMAGAGVNVLAVAGFAVAMLFNSLAASYVSSIFIAFSYMLLVSAFAQKAQAEAKTAAYAALGFGAMYALCNALVYFIQLTTVKAGGLSPEASKLLDFQQYGMIFSMDMLGYCLMSISTFFAGLTVRVHTRADRWLKALLMIHGVFAIACFIVPMLGMFDTANESSALMGTLILEFWCIYFIPVGVLSALHFSKTEQPKA